MKAIADEAAAQAPSVRRLLVVRRLGERQATTPWTAPARSVVGRTRPTPPVAQGRLPASRPPAWPGTEAGRQTDPELPYMIIYTSGTTGRPKEGAVHVLGGFPIKGAQDLAHTFDLRAGDALFWFTDLGWMMGPWAISGTLLLDARLVLYEGAPDFPGPDRLWSLVARPPGQPPRAVA